MSDEDQKDETAAQPTEDQSAEQSGQDAQPTEDQSADQPSESSLEQQTRASEASVTSDKPISEQHESGSSDSE